MRQEINMVDQMRVKGGVLLGALVSGALAAGTLTGAPTANATCASFWGINNGGGCTSKLFSIAIGIGTGATATANGLFGGAFAIGTNANTQTDNAFDFATAVGDNAIATADGIFGIAVQVGTGVTYTESTYGLGGGFGANIAINVTPGNAQPNGDNQTSARGTGNIAVNLFSNASSVKGSYLTAIGLLNTAVNVLGPASDVNASQPTFPGPLAIGNLAFNVFGSENVLVAGSGPFAVTGAFNQHNVNVYQQSPGINLYTRLALGAAAVSHAAKTSAPTATAVHTGKGTASAATSVGGSKRTIAPAAASVGHKR
jgi:hypothetical protein